MNTLLTNERERYGAVAYLAAVLTSDEVRRGKLDKKAHTEKELRDLLDVPEANRLTGIILRAYGMSILITVVGVSCNVVLTVLFAYPLSRRDLPGRRAISPVADGKEERACVSNARQAR